MQNLLLPPACCASNNNSASRNWSRSSVWVACCRVSRTVWRRSARGKLVSSREESCSHPFEVMEVEVVDVVHPGGISAPMALAFRGANSTQVAALVASYLSLLLSSISAHRTRWRCSPRNLCRDRNHPARPYRLRVCREYVPLEDLRNSE